MSVFLGILLVLAVPVLVTVVGLVVVRALSGAAPDADDWIDAPALGIATVVVVLTPLTLAGVRVGTSAWLLVILCVALAFGVARAGRWRGVSGAVPPAAVVMVLTVLLVHAAGVALAGMAYAGRGWGDQFNYTALAHYITTYGAGEVPRPSDPVAIVGAAYVDTRIGQSVLQAWLASILRVGPAAVFEPLALLAPVLMACGLASVGRVLGIGRGTYLLAATGSVAPALAMLHLEGFLSQSLAVGLVVHLPALMARAAARQTVGAYLRVALVHAAAVSIYLEYLPVLLAIVMTGTVVALPGVSRRTRHVVAAVLILVLPVVLGFTRGLSKVLSYMNVPVLGHLYPWALQPEGVARLWLGDLAVPSGQQAATGWLCFALLWLVAGAYGMLRLAEERVLDARRDTARAPHLALVLCLLGVVTVPAVALSRGAPYAYQFYKTLMGAAPVLAWAASLAVWRVIAVGQGTAARLVASALVGAVGAAMMTATADMSLAAARRDLSEAEHTRRRQTTALMLDERRLAVSAALAHPSGDVLLCATDSTWNAAHANAWFGYAARHHRSWALNPRVNDQHLSDLAGADYLRQVPPPSPTTVLVTGGPGGWLDVNESAVSGVAPQGYRAAPWGNRRLGACSPLLTRQRERGAVFAVAPTGSTLIIAASAATSAVLLFETDPTAVATLTVTVDGRAARVSTGGAGAVAVPLDLRAGVTPVVFGAGGTTVVELGDVQLAEARSAVPVLRIDNPNYVERVEGNRFFWLGREPADLHYFSLVAGSAELAVDSILGPSLAGTPLRHIDVAVDDAPPRGVETRGERFVVPLTLRAGWGRVRLQARDEPDTILRSDPRTLLLGVRSVTLQPSLRPN